MSSGPSPSLTYRTFVELNPTDASTSSFRVGVVDPQRANAPNAPTFVVTDSGNSGILGDTPGEAANITTTPPNYFSAQREYNYWGKSQDDGTIVRFPSTRSADGFTYFLLTNSDPSSFRQFDVVPSSDFTQAPLVLCFASGTQILTSRGEVAVEHLQVGDTAVTASGRHRPITWIGQRDLGSAEQPMPRDQAPVRVRAGAFGHALPARDLLLSPGHPVLVGADADNAGGVLVPVMCLINGTSIARTDAASVTYWHVELDAHDILLAEGLPAESYIDLGTRPWFDGATGALVNPDFIGREMRGRCRPVAVDGPVVERERMRLAAVFTVTLDAQCGWEGTETWITP
ncbi:Hint domain-containing protein [Methylorubrum extorquens]|uniref:Hint domain-containing protein n=1 Tax=Methylorubrum extorquens TaxID=408 RepID=A0AAX3WLG9_METEX|nr:Hint domain-containing protein [Methylorubrum extorquens]WHQ71253.1 Hint domain-containing protein [Methylorubrum extorquens]